MSEPKTEIERRLEVIEDRQNRMANAFGTLLIMLVQINEKVVKLETSLRNT